MTIKPISPAVHQSILRSDHGFSLTETLIVIVIIGILAGVAVYQFTTSESNDVKSAANGIVSDIAYAQEVAMQQHRGTKVTFIYGGTPPGSAHGLKRGWGRGRGHRGGFGHGNRGDPNSYAIEYQTGGFVMNPVGSDSFLVDMGDDVGITSSSRILEFDSAGRLTVLYYSWPSGATSMTCCTLNGSVNIVISKHIGKAWVQD